MKKLRKSIAAALIAAAILATPVLAASGQVEKVLNYLNITISVDGEDLLAGSNVEPFIVDDVTYVPVRAIFEALGYAVEWDGEAKTAVITSPEQEETPAALPAGMTSMTIRTDGKATLTDAEFDSYFDGGAEQGVASLVAAGAVTVNGAPVNGQEIDINGGKALWKEEDGTWSWRTHIMYSGANQSYEEASVNFVVGLSKLRGPSYTLTFADGKVTGIDFFIYDACMVQSVSAGDTYTTVAVSGESDGSMNRADPSAIQFPNALVEADSKGVLPSGQCLIIYWQDEAGWHLKRADSQAVTIPAGGIGLTDSLINLEYSQSWNRPTQPVKAIAWMGSESAEMIQWFLCDGITSGISRADARADLPAALERAQEALDTIAVSAAGDGSDVEEGQMWVTQEYHDTFAQVIADVTAVYEDDSLLNSDYEKALFTLSLSYGGDGTNYSKTWNAFSDGIGFMTFAQKSIETAS